MALLLFQRTATNCILKPSVAAAVAVTPRLMELVGTIGSSARESVLVEVAVRMRASMLPMLQAIIPLKLELEEVLLLMVKLPL